MRRSSFAMLVVALVTAMVIAPAARSAEKIMICAFSEVQKCKPFGQCRRASPKDVNVAPIIMLDLEKKELVSASIGDSGRREAIEGVKTTDDTVFLYGQQDEEAWTAVISLKTGLMTASVSADGVGFVMFGNCAPK
jgi:hypothetical protein